MIANREITNPWAIRTTTPMHWKQKYKNKPGISDGATAEAHKRTQTVRKQCRFFRDASHWKAIKREPALTMISTKSYGYGNNTPNNSTHEREKKTASDSKTAKYDAEKSPHTKECARARTKLHQKRKKQIRHKLYSLVWYFDFLISFVWIFFCFVLVDFFSVFCSCVFIIVAVAFAAVDVLVVFLSCSFIYCFFFFSSCVFVWLPVFIIDSFKNAYKVDIVPEVSAKKVIIILCTFIVQFFLMFGNHFLSSFHSIDLSLSQSELVKWSDSKKSLASDVRWKKEKLLHLLCN